MIKTGEGSTLPSHFYVSKAFKPGATAAPNTTRIRGVANNILFALGVALLELSFGRPLKVFQTAEDLNSSGNEDGETAYFTAVRLAREIWHHETKNYATAVSRCINGTFDGADCDFHLETFREKFFDGVVVPLRADFKAAQI